MSRRKFRGDEFRALIALTLPILITQWFQVGMGVVDIAIAGHFDDAVQASIGLGVMVWNPLLLFCAGVFMSIAILTAHEYGAGKSENVARIWHNGVAIGVVMILLVMGVMIFLSEPILRLIRVDEELLEGSVHYLQALSIGVPAIFLFNTLRSVCEGVARPLPITIVSGVGFIVNAILNYLLVHGFAPLGIPSFGATGSGVGTGLTFWVMLALLIYFTREDHRLKQLNLFSTPVKIGGLVKEQLRIGLPAGMTLLAEVAIFSAAGLILGQFGKIVVGSHQISLAITSMTFMIPLSMSMALTTLVGQRMGRSDTYAARRVGNMGRFTVMGIMLMTSIILFNARYHLPQLFNSNPEIIAMSAGLIIYSIIFQLPDGLQISANGILRGMKDTKIPMILSITSYWLVAFPLCYYLGVVRGMAAEGVWIGLIVGLTTSAILLNTRLFIINRRLKGEEAKDAE